MKATQVSKKIRCNPTSKYLLIHIDPIHISDLRDYIFYRRSCFFFRPVDVVSARSYFFSSLLTHTRPMTYIIYPSSYLSRSLYIYFSLPLLPSRLLSQQSQLQLGPQWLGPPPSSTRWRGVDFDVSINSRDPRGPGLNRAEGVSVGVRGYVTDCLWCWKTLKKIRLFYSPPPI